MSISQAILNIEVIAIKFDNWGGISRPKTLHYIYEIVPKLRLEWNAR